jgi:hypothetical protein
VVAAVSLVRELGGFHAGFRCAYNIARKAT